jgi:hypothetical protein
MMVEPKRFWKTGFGIAIGETAIHDLHSRDIGIEPR